MSLNVRYRAVTLRSVLDRIFRSRGFDPESVAMTPRECLVYCDLVNRWLRRAWDAAHWPQLRICQKRYFRARWSAAVAYPPGSEVWHGGRYWACAEGAAAGAEPGADGAWGEITGAFTRFLTLATPWDAVAVDEAGYDLGAFAYADYPVGNPGARAIPCQQFADAIVLPDDAVTADGGVWCVFKPECPRFTMEAWDAGRLYAAGDAVYVPGDGNDYLALRPNDGADPLAALEDWARLGFPEMFSDYVVLGAVSELQSDDEGKYKTRAMAEDELDRLVHKKTALAGAAPRARVRRR